MIAIIEYNAGNSKSVENALKQLGYASVVSDNIDVIKQSDKVIFPGVGEAATAMNHLKKKGLDSVIKQLQQPVLGICLGLQLMCQYSEEGHIPCMGIFDTVVKKFPKKALVPQIGWNDFVECSGVLFEGRSREDDVYYVHSFYAEICKQTTAVCDYILPFSSALQKDNFYATQFHPEKSAQVGSDILLNFLQL